MSMGRAEALDTRDVLSAAVQTTRRAAREAQWRAWLTASEGCRRAAGHQDIAPPTGRGAAKRRRSAAGWRILRGLAFGAVAMGTLLG